MVTHTANDEYVFRVPPLRNVELTPPYFHSGSSWDLRQAVAVLGTSQLRQKLTEEEISKITAFPYVADKRAAAGYIPDLAAKHVNNSEASAIGLQAPRLRSG